MFPGIFIIAEPGRIQVLKRFGRKSLDEEVMNTRMYAIVRIGFGIGLLILSSCSSRPAHPVEAGPVPVYELYKEEMDAGGTLPRSGTNSGEYGGFKSENMMSPDVWQQLHDGRKSGNPGPGVSESGTRLDDKPGENSESNI